MAQGTKIGEAYVQIYPTTEGIGDGIKNSLNGVSDEFDKAGTKAGNVFAGAIGGVLGGAIENIISSAISGAVKLIKTSIESSAEFEQLKGGTEAIFSGMDTSRIMNDAKGAYKDLGMSANDYLTKINDVGAAFKATMGDEKGYNTARKGLKAISDYASGTGRDVGELSDKFALITRSTASYQSIADQFSGILPATSQDFLKQAQAAGDLSKSYKKLSEVPIAEYQQAVASALEDGAAAMGLAGKTAEEAETTVKGSINSMSAAWDNFIMSLTSPDINTAEMTQNLIDAFSNVVENLTPVLMELMPAIVEALATAAVELAPVLNELVFEIGYQMAAQLPRIQERVKNAFFEVLKNILHIDNISGLIEGLVNVLRGMFDFAFQALATIFGGAFGSLIAELFSVKKIKSKITQIITDLKEAGANMVQGLIDGFKAKFENLKNAPIDAIKGMVNDIKKLLGIKSPSRVFRDEVGAMMAEGLKIGFANEMTKVNASIEHDVNTTFDIAKDDMFRTITRRPTASVTNNGDIANEIAKALGTMTINNNVTLEGDARTLFNVMQKTNNIYKTSTGRSAFA